MQRERNFKQEIPPVRIGEGEEITYDQATAAYRRAATFWNALQSPHGHWPAENAGPNFYFPPLVNTTLHLTVKEIDYLPQTEIFTVKKIEKL